MQTFCQWGDACIQCKATSKETNFYETRFSFRGFVGKNITSHYTRIFEIRRPVDREVVVYGVGSHNICGLAEINFSSNKVTQLEPGNFFPKTTQKQKQTVRKVFKLRTRRQDFKLYYNDTYWTVAWNKSELKEIQNSDILKAGQGLYKIDAKKRWHLVVVFFPATKSTSQPFMSTGGSLPCMESSLIFTNKSFLAVQDIRPLCGLVAHSVNDTFWLSVSSESTAELS